MEATFRVDDGSKRHHYIAEYFSKGFANGEGLLYVYDKKKDEYQKPRSPKQLFYEEEGNTAYWGTVRNTLAEQSYAYLDRLTAEQMKVLRTKPQDSLTPEDSSFMMYHMVLQFMRCPSNLVTYQKLYDDIGIWAPDLYDEYPLLKLLPSDETIFKYSRAFVPGILVNRLAREIPGPYPIRILEHFEQDFLVLSDNPVVYGIPPFKLAGLFTHNMLAVSSRRLFVSGNLDRLGTDLQQLESYNVGTVAFAARLVCASNRLALQNAVDAWKWASARPGDRQSLRSDAGGYWKGLATTVRETFDYLSTDVGWHEEHAIKQTTGIEASRLKAALDTLVQRKLIITKVDASGMNYRVI